jgi:hypothetical protein
VRSQERRKIGLASPDQVMEADMVLKKYVDMEFLPSLGSKTLIVI